jgi:hypothetical protein
MLRTTSDDLAELTRRLDRLERGHRRWRRVGAGSTLALVVVLAAGAVQRDAVPKVIRAERFVAVDEAGKDAVTIRAPEPDRPRGGIEIVGRGGKRLITMGIRDERPYLALTNPDQTYLLVLDVAPDTGPGIVARNTQADTGVMFNVGPRGEAAIGVMNGDHPS